MDEGREKDLLRNIRSLKDEVEEKNRQVTHAEKQSEDLLQELKDEKAKTDELYDKIKALKEKEANNEKYITKIEGDAKDFQSQVVDLQSDKAQLEAQIGSERGDHQRVVVEQHSLRAKYDALRTDANGVRSKLETEQTENKRLRSHIDELKATIKGLEHVQTELEEEKKISDGLRNQWARLKDELPRFNPDPQVAIKPQIAPGPGPDEQPPKTPRSLAFELEGRSSLSGSIVESGAESGDSKLSDVASNDGSSSSSDDSADNDDDYDTEIGTVDGHEVMRNVYVPYRTYAHNPFRCWFQVDINTALVFRKSLPRSWWNVDPNNNPPAAQTLFWFALHLVFYYFLYVCYQNYCEREIWISANESARKLLVEVLALRNRDRGITSQIFSEKAVRLIDHFILYAFSLFKVETQPWKIPG